MTDHVNRAERLLPAKIDRTLLSDDKMGNVRPEVMQFISTMRYVASMYGSRKTRRMPYRHQRTAQMFRIRPRRVEIPAPLVRTDIFFSDIWWNEEDIDHDIRDLPSNAIPRPDGAFLIKEVIIDIRLLNGQKIQQARQVLLSSSGQRFKEFYATLPDGSQIPFEKISQQLLPLYFPNENIIEEAKYIIVCEGFAAAMALSKRGQPTVGTLTGAIHLPSRTALQPLIKKQLPILLWPDNDDIGVRHMERIAERLSQMGVEHIRIIRWVGARRKADAADFKGTDDELQLLINNSKRWESKHASRFRGILGVSSDTIPLRLSLPPEERSPVPSLISAPVMAPSLGEHLNKMIEQLKVMSNDELIDDRITEELQSQLEKLLMQLRTTNILDIE